MTDFEPFDLARAEAGEPVQFRCGNHSVKYNCALHNDNGQIHAILFIARGPNGYEYSVFRNKYGEGWNIGPENEIVMKPKSPNQRWWFQIWRNVDGSPRNNGVFYNTEEAVLKAQSEGSEIAFVDLPPPTR